MLKCLKFWTELFFAWLTWHNIQNKNINDEKKNQEILFYTKKIAKLIGQNDRTGGKHEQVPGKEARSQITRRRMYHSRTVHTQY